MIKRCALVQCDWCGFEERSSHNQINEIKFEKTLESWGWIIHLVAGVGKLHFCNEECYGKYKNNKEPNNESTKD